MGNFVSAVIVAAGKSTRMGGNIKKQFINLDGKPVILHTVEAFEKSDMVDEIVVVTSKEDIDDLYSMLLKNNIKKLSKIVAGSDSRQRSVECGINAISDECTYIAIHDGARALISTKVIDKVVNDAFVHSASAAAVRVKDTIKVVTDDLFVEYTPDRSKLFLVQTPQVFKKELYLEALANAHKDKKDYTDDCQLIESIGSKVHICIGDYSNIKLTTKEDIDIALSIMKNKEDK